MCGVWVVAGEGIVRFYMDKPDWDGTAHFYMATVRNHSVAIDYYMYSMYYHP